MADVGRPSDLTKELFGKIKESILNGNNLGETAKICEIPVNTFYTWTSDNYLKLADRIEEWHAERRLGKSVKKIEELIDSEEEKIALGASTFFAETLGKRIYSKRTEQTGADGEKLTIQVINYGENTVRDMDKSDGVLPTSDEF